MHIPEVETALKELARVLKPGGRLVLKENNARSLHVRYWEPSLRMLKKVLGRKIPERSRTERGIEEWEQGESGGLMVRKTDMDWLVRFYADLGLNLVARFAGTFTELHTSVPSRPLKRAIYALNQRWASDGRRCDLAMGNILVFERA
jgi:ubiquinone/menaquinone biosynthesis C-methylase UbiE